MLQLTKIKKKININKIKTNGNYKKKKTFKIKTKKNISYFKILITLMFSDVPSCFISSGHVSALYLVSAA